MRTIEQGFILSIEGINGPVLVVSKNYFNHTGQIIACPVVKNSGEDPLHIKIETDDVSGMVLCEQMKMLDMKYRGYKKIAEIEMNSIIDITDAIQSIFDYYSYK